MYKGSACVPSRTGNRNIVHRLCSLYNLDTPFSRVWIQCFPFKDTCQCIHIMLKTTCCTFLGQGNAQVGDWNRFAQVHARRQNPMNAVTHVHPCTSERIGVALRMRDVTEEHVAWRVSPSCNELSLVDDKVQRNPKQGNVHDAAPSAAHFRFDAVFHGNATTRDVYRSMVQPIVHSAMNGVNGCVLAYGGTGSGKTYTMVGDIACEGGLVTLALGDILAAAGRLSMTHDVNISATMVELYDEQISDLFATQATDSPANYQPPIQILVCTSPCTLAMENCYYPESAD